MDMIVNMNNYHDIQQLIERFFDGNTSLKEEQLLYEFFDKHHDLPKELETYREMFMGFGAIAFDDAKHIKSKSHRKIFYLLSGMAASLLLCLGIFAAVQIHEDRMLARNYEGSYIIVNGERIDDLSRIKPDIEHALSKANAIESNLKENSVIEDAEQNLLNNVGDPEERARIQQLLNE